MFGLQVSDYILCVHVHSTVWQDYNEWLTLRSSFNWMQKHIDDTQVLMQTLQMWRLKLPATLGQEVLIFTLGQVGATASQTDEQNTPDG